MMNKDLYKIVEKRVKDRKGAHDFSHFLRVRNIALKIADAEKADREIVEAMALLHDLIRYEDEREENSVEDTLKEAGKILKELDMTDKMARIILDGIKSHSLHSKTHKEPSTLEAKILFDADKIDSVGEIGIARWFMTVGNRNISVKEAAMIYLKTLEKQERKMKGKLYTKLGTEMIRDRIIFTKNFLKNCISFSLPQSST